MAEPILNFAEHARLLVTAIVEGHKDGRTTVDLEQVAESALRRAAAAGVGDSWVGTFVRWESDVRQQDNAPGYVIDANGCHIWTGSLGSGYGQIKVKGRMRKAHRIRYEREVGPIPEGMQIDHLCRNRACCNPAHLEVVTRSENMLRATAAKERCKHGHPYTHENMKVQGRRVLCRTCRQEHDRNRKARAKLRAAELRGEKP